MLTVNWRTVYEVQQAFRDLKQHLINEDCDPASQYYIDSIETDILAILKGEITVECDMRPAEFAPTD